jgi:hypothetical protein
MFDLGYWLGSHIFWIVWALWMIGMITWAWDRIWPAMHQMFRAIGPGLAQLAALIPVRRPVNQVHEEIRRQADWDFWLQARDHGTPAEQAIASEILTALGYVAPPLSDWEVRPNFTSRTEHLIWTRNHTTNADVRDDCNRELKRIAEQAAGPQVKRKTENEVSE